MRHVSDADKITLMEFYSNNKTATILWLNEQDDTTYEVIFVRKPLGELDTNKSEWKLNLEFMQTI